MKMELKNYFKKYGIGWIVIGILISILLFFISVISKPFYVIEEVLNFPWYPLPIFTSILMGLGVFLLGFFGFTRLFWLLGSGEAILILFRILESGSEGSWSLILTVPLLFLLGIIGITWEIAHYYSNKKNIKRAG